jgi:hypothetical protein
MRSKSWKFCPPENRTRNQGGRGFAAGGGEFGRMLNGVGIQMNSKTSYAHDARRTTPQLTRPIRPRPANRAKNQRLEWAICRLELFK